MAQRRSLHKKISVNTELNEVSDQAVLLYTWTIPHLDDFGRITGNIKKFTAEVMPLRRGKPGWDYADIEKYLIELENSLDEAGKPLILRYQVQGVSVIWFQGFEELQEGLHKRTKSIYPAPPEVPGNSRKFPEILSQKRNETKRRGNEVETKRNRNEGEKEKEKYKKEKENALANQSFSEHSIRGDQCSPLENADQAEPTNGDHLPDDQCSEAVATAQKIKFAEFVSMTNDQYSLLVEKLGQEDAGRCIEILDNYKGASGKKYKSDYRAILVWVIKRLEEDDRKSNAASGNKRIPRAFESLEEWIREKEQEEKTIDIKSN